jgi:large subunit ribosomal protein L19
MKKKKQQIEKQSIDKLEVKPGMVVRVHLKIKDVNPKGEEKERIQVFEGLVLAHKHGKEPGATITVRKVSEGIGVEKIFPLNSPLVEKIELVDQKIVRRAKLYYTRNYKKRLKSVSEKTAK